MPGLKTDLPMPGNSLLSEVKKGTATDRSKKGKSAAADIGLSTAFDVALKKEMGEAVEGRQCGKGTNRSGGLGKQGQSRKDTAKDTPDAAGLSIIIAGPAALNPSAEVIESKDGPDARAVDPALRVLKFAAMKAEAEKVGATELAKESKASPEGGKRSTAPAVTGDDRFTAVEKKSTGPSASGDVFGKVLKGSAMSSSRGTSEAAPQLAAAQENAPSAVRDEGAIKKTDPLRGESAEAHKEIGKTPQPSAVRENPLTAVLDGNTTESAAPLQSSPVTPGKEKGKEPEGLKMVTAARIQPDQEDRPKGAVPSSPSNVKEPGINESSAKDRIRKESRSEVRAAAEGASSALHGDDSKTQRTPADGTGNGNSGDKENAWKAAFLSARDGKMEDREQSLGKISPKEQPVTKSGKSAVSAERPDPLSVMKETGDQKVSAFRVSKSSVETPFSQSLFERIAEGSDMLVRTGQDRVRLTLTPPQLGTLELDLIVKQDQVRMVLTTENRDVCQTLQLNLDQLKTVLQGQGFDVDRLDVFVQDRGERGDGMSRGEMSFGREQSGNRGGDSLREEPLAALSRRSDRDLFRGEEGISIFA